ncbi:DUF885 family protein, partial [Burkholderia sp. SIMBA_013]
VENGVRAPRFAYEQIIKEAKGLTSGAPFDEEGDSSLLEDAKNKLSSLQESDEISAEQADKYEKEVRKVLLERFQPSYEALISFLESDIENTDEIATGVHRLENGEAYYNARLANYTTTDLT